jgi:hypothetical protein
VGHDHDTPRTDPLAHGQTGKGDIIRETTPLGTPVLYGRFGSRRQALFQNEALSAIGFACGGHIGKK